MQASLACRRYLQRHSEPGLKDTTCPAGCWQNALVIPAYCESPELLQRLRKLPAASGKTLVILVLNRPDSDLNPDCNSALREACKALPAGSNVFPSTTLHTLNQCTDLYLHDLDTLSGPLPAAQGVGLARKIGCDLAFRWMMQAVNL